MKNYGLPYKGSKSRIADKIINILPKADTFVDLFCGGGAVTHAAMLSGKYNNFVMNDIELGIPQLFVDAISGKYKGEKRWISREDFFRLKDNDAYVRLIWSFGNNQKDYLYGKDIEYYKRGLHYTLLFNRDVLKYFGINLYGAEQLPYSKEKRLAIKRIIGAQTGSMAKSELESLQRLERLQSLESLQRLESLGRLILSSKSYERVSIPKGSVVYCGIPYKDTTGYLGSFDHKDYYDWVRSSELPIYTSEYSMPDDFVEALSEKVRSTYSASSNTTKREEKVFLHKKWVK